MSATNSESAGLPASPLLRLPFEIRLIIYEYLLFPTTHPSTSTSTSIANLLPDFHTYYSEDTNNSPFTLSVRTIDPFLASQGSRTWRRRSVYHVRTGKSFPSANPYNPKMDTIYVFKRQTLKHIANKQNRESQKKTTYISNSPPPLTPHLRPLPNRNNTHNLPRPALALHSAPTPQRAIPAISQPPNPRRSQ